MSFFELSKEERHWTIGMVQFQYVDWGQKSSLYVFSRLGFFFVTRLEGEHRLAQASRASLEYFFSIQPTENPNQNI